MSCDGFRNFAHNTINRRLQICSKSPAKLWRLSVAKSSKLANSCSIGGILDALPEKCTSSSLIMSKYFLLCPSKTWICPGTHGPQDALTDLINPLSNASSEECFQFVLIFANYPFLSKILSKNFRVEFKGGVTLTQQSFSFWGSLEYEWAMGLSHWVWLECTSSVGWEYGR